MAAALLTEEKCEINGVPQLRDVDVMCKLLERLGAHVEKDPEGKTVDITAGSDLSCEAPYDLVKMMRASILVLGALLIRTGRGVIPPSWRMCDREETCRASSERSESSRRSRR